MKNFFEWFEGRDADPNRPWMILGKGPSFAKRGLFDLGQYYSVGLNHVVREERVTVAHMIDFDVVDACGEAIEKNAALLVLPWIPHVKNRPGSRTLRELAESNAILRRLDGQGRLLWYNLCTAPVRHGESPAIQVRFFSAEAVLNLLAQAGVRQIRSLGVDGGASYSSEFRDLADKTLLANKRSSFDRQFESIASIIMRTGIDYAPLDVESPIRIYVAATEDQMLAVKVLEYSIRKHASMSVQVVSLHLTGVEIPLPKDPRNHPRTPFSFQRFVIPEVVGYKGRAIYLDSDMQVFKDIRKLWILPFGEAELLTVQEPARSGRGSQFSVMLLNCDSLKWNIREMVAELDSGRLTYERLMYEMTVAARIRYDVDPAWNSLERYAEGETALVHYTDMDKQPWVSTENPLGYLWVRDLFEAIDCEFIPLEYVREHVKRGAIRPSLLYQVEHRVEDGLLLPKKASLLDKEFIAPYQRMDSGGWPGWRARARWLRAAVRHYYQVSPIYRLRRKLRNYLSR